jgi:hypothetical protein
MKKLIFLISLLLITFIGYSQLRISDGLYKIVDSLTTVADTTFTVFIPNNHSIYSIVIWDNLDATDGVVSMQTSANGVYYTDSIYYSTGLLVTRKTMLADSSDYTIGSNFFPAFDLRLKLSKGSNTTWLIDWYVLLKPR